MDENIELMAHIYKVSDMGVTSTRSLPVQNKTNLSTNWKMKLKQGASCAIKK